ncbi:hypothetical protein QN277_016284 [Acacia crassicarpa]|uniref:Senescence-associated carboxylesterase 101 n=1 Tax=Acacia crassicarpa TaxID=499986 RepID=A0AAE1MWC8_9FABA|nr:hypothetical protein QN277_016284 [Acacia crassicarpa]
MTQHQVKAFSGGLESASSVASSGILTSLWNLISNLYAEAQSSTQNLFWKIVSNESGLTAITFWTTQNHDQPDLLPFSNTDDNPFKFICSKTNPNFSLNHSAFSLFNQYRTQLDQLKSETDLKKPVIVTGHGVGGSIASLFTLLLLEKMNPASDKRPLCITFGSPLIGDGNFQKAIWQSSNWNSCFLHVASLLDPLVSSSISNNSYSPFGIFLLCSGYGSSCFESLVSVRKLLNLTSQLNNQGLQQNCHYGSIVENLHRKAICKDFDGPNIPRSNLLQESLALQLCALGFPQLLQLQETDLKNLVEELDNELLKPKKRFNPGKKLNDMKEKMANLEWYKKDSKKKGIGYYDMFKGQTSAPDIVVTEFIRQLNGYWEDMVEEAEKQPQKEGAAFRTRWLYAGTNYRRMVEPLYIAGYYKDGKRDYINNGRTEHYKQLEKWLKEDKKSQSIGRTNNVESILTLDSCFWAHVEEALISCQDLKTTGSNEARNSLDGFEKYVYGLLKDYAVSPEIFLGGSSFMRWWREYFGIKGASHDTEFANFMKNPTNYKKYMEGAYNFL